MYLSVELPQAVKMVLKEVKPKEIEYIPLLDSLNRVVGKAIYAENAIPHFRKSPFDGYALKSSQIKGATEINPVALKVTGLLKAGDNLDHVFEPKSEDELTAIKIMTGAPVPDFYDAVIKKEKTDKGDLIVKAFAEVPPDRNVIGIGEDVMAGDLVVKASTKIHPNMIAMFSNLGMDKIPVFKRPKIGILSTGDELIPPGEALVLGKVYNSNLFGLYANLVNTQCEVTNYGVIKDDLDSINNALMKGLDENDLLITTGGVSVGDFDFLGRAYSDCGIKKIFWGVRMRPGSPILAGKKNGKCVISLPGNPASAMITYEKIVVPVIRKIRGYVAYYKKTLHGVLMESFDKKSPVKRFLRVQVNATDKGYELYLSGKQNAGVLLSMVCCNGLAEVASSEVSVEKGAVLPFIFTDEGGG